MYELFPKPPNFGRKTLLSQHHQHIKHEDTHEVSMRYLKHTSCPETPVYKGGSGHFMRFFALQSDKVVR